MALKRYFKDKELILDKRKNKFEKIFLFVGGCEWINVNYFSDKIFEFFLNSFSISIYYRSWW